ncbi:MAG: hypothetical protein H7096_09745 [Flavobacterium sp.]|nr:hypothetical protein [Pedobacter sp.]
MIAIQTRIIRKFKAVGAFNPDSAIPLSEIGAAQNRVFNKLVRKGIILQNYQGLFYLNEIKQQELFKKKLAVLKTVIIIISITTLLIYFWKNI